MAIWFACDACGTYELRTPDRGKLGSVTGTCPACGSASRYFPGVPPEGAKRMIPDHIANLAGKKNRPGGVAEPPTVLIPDLAKSDSAGRQFRAGEQTREMAGLPAERTGSTTAKMGRPDFDRVPRPNDPPSEPAPAPQPTPGSSFAKTKSIEPFQLGSSGEAPSVNPTPQPQIPRAHPSSDSSESESSSSWGDKKTLIVAPIKASDVPRPSGSTKALAPVSASQPTPADQPAPKPAEQTAPAQQPSSSAGERAGPGPASSSSSTVAGQGAPLVTPRPMQATPAASVPSVPAPAGGIPTASGSQSRPDTGPSGSWSGPPSTDQAPEGSGSRSWQTPNTSPGPETQDDTHQIPIVKPGSGGGPPWKLIAAIVVVGIIAIAIWTVAAALMSG